eukprot:CAMPEP_0204003028 /NCGR_PEP_ID=MMETSP0360-20130528/17335_1 /ASSEMBLY_ACC=CAM_ASM_000342 /TAXON_ID=268821 /ORGANISM="Scrippsiella Hangoei, Strain SHTV-5" /LENGTH=37 /DNA_ID= /DNA_START= /DNA_END= /DNA_ORIENTATION=
MSASQQQLSVNSDAVSSLASTTSRLRQHSTRLSSKSL